MANEITSSRMPGMGLAIAGKQFLREAFLQAFERVGGIDAVVDWVQPEIEIVDPITGTKRYERKRNDANFGQLLGLMARLEPKDLTIRDDRAIEAAIEAIEAEFVEITHDE